MSQRNVYSQITNSENLCIQLEVEDNDDIGGGERGRGWGE